MKLWKKHIDPDSRIEKFTVGDDYILDQQLVYFDCKASMAHAKMLYSIGILTQEELSQLLAGLNEIIDLDKQGAFEIRLEDEDCHTAIENYLSAKYGEAGRKIHTGRSRNDQVLTALRLFEKAKLDELKEAINAYDQALQKTILRFGAIVMPGYTHMQKAMPTTVAVWLQSFSCANKDNLLQLSSLRQVLDQNPLGTAAGFGIPSLKLDREMTTRELGFAKVMENPIYAQLSRGKFEAAFISLLSQIMFDLCKLASDLILFNTREFGFVHLSEAICTGSSIMPQKKNPDVLELLRGKYHIVLGEEMKLKSLIGNLISGYNRDIQLSKAPLMYSIQTSLDSLNIAVVVLEEM